MFICGGEELISVIVLFWCNYHKEFFADNISQMQNLPSCFTREHLPKRKTIFSVRDPEGRGWDVIYIPHVSGRGCLSGGWGAYARANNLEIGDICVFEVVGECQMKVHVFHWRHYLQAALLWFLTSATGRGLDWVGNYVENIFGNLLTFFIEL